MSQSTVPEPPVLEEAACVDGEAGFLEYVEDGFALAADCEKLFGCEIVPEEEAAFEAVSEPSKEDVFGDSVLNAACELLWGKIDAEGLLLLTVTLFCALQAKSDKTKKKAVRKAAYFAVFNYSAPPKKIKPRPNQWD